MFYRLSKKQFLLAFFASSLILFSGAITRNTWAQPACTVDADCDDGNFCDGAEVCGRCGSDVTRACCLPGTPPADLTPCGDDSIFCNGINVCADRVCTPQGDIFQNPRCGANGECADFCDEANDVCADPAGTSCTDDGNPCTTDECNGAGSCVSTNNNFECNDGVNCTENDVCAGGVCAGSPIQCDDGITCTLDSCVEASGSCLFDESSCQCQTDADCEDGNACTDEFCCSDRRTCTPDTLFTCIRSNNSNPCDDGLFCNGGDTCGGGTCSIHTGDPCAGGTQCAETCDEAGDDCFAPVGVACDDNDILTTTQCDGNGKCTVISKDQTQGATLCSLRPGLAGARWGMGLLAMALTSAAWFLTMRKKS